MSAFENHDYRRLFGAQLVALFGTGLATVALGLLAYDLAGPRAGAVIGTALTIKMAMYILVAPLAAAYADRLPRRTFLAALDLVRAVIVLALPFITEIWQIYLLIGLLQAASAAFTPTFQAVIPDVVADERDYTRALSHSQVAFTMENMLSPVLAALALTFMSFNWLFVGTSLGFAASAVLVLSTSIPDARPHGQANAWERVAAGLRLFAVSPPLRGMMAFNVVAASAGAIVVVNTVNYVRDVLGGSQVDVAVTLAASGAGTLAVALALPRVLDRLSDRAVMAAGAVALIVGSAAAVFLSAAGLALPAATRAVWVLIGAGVALINTPVGRVLRRAVRPEALPQAFAAQFSLSHVAWLITYAFAGYASTNAGFTLTWSILAAAATAGSVAALLLWTHTPEVEAVVTAGQGHRPGAVAAAVAVIAAGTRKIERPPSGGAVAGLEAQTAAGTLAAGQCSCVRPV